MRKIGENAGIAKPIAVCVPDNMPAEVAEQEGSNWIVEVAVENYFRRLAAEWSKIAI